MVVLALLLVGAACTSTPHRGPEPTASGPTRTSSTGTATTSVAPEAPTSALIRSPKGGSLLVRGTYPRVESRCVRYHRPRLAARYPGALSVKRSDDGTLALDGHAVVRGLPEGHRRGPAVVAAGCARGAGDRRPQLRARDDRVGRRPGRDAEDADLRDDLVPGLPGDPGPVRPEHPAVVRGGPANVGRGAPVPRTGPPTRCTSRPRTATRTGTTRCSAARRCRYLRPVVERDDGASAAVALERPGTVRRPGDASCTRRGEWPAHRAISSVGPGGLDRHGERRRERRARWT